MVAKSQNFVGILGAQKPTWAKLLEFDFFIWKHKAIEILPEQKSPWGQFIFLHISYNEIVDKVVK